MSETDIKTLKPGTTVKYRYGIRWMSGPFQSAHDFKSAVTVNDARNQKYILTSDRIMSMSEFDRQRLEKLRLKDLARVTILYADLIKAWNDGKRTALELAIATGRPLFVTVNRIKAARKRGFLTVPPIKQ